MKTLVYFRLIAPRTALAGLLLLTGVGCAARPSGTELDDALKKAGVAEAIVFKVHGDAVNVGRVPASDVLTLPDAICRTLRTDPDVQAALAQVRVAEAESDQQRLLPNPVVSILARFPENSGKPVIEAEVGIELLSLLERPGRIRVADNRLRGASADVVGVVLDKIADVEERYASIQSLDAQMPVLEEQRQRLDRFVRLAQDRLNKGEATRLDVTALETQQLDLEVETAQKRLALRQARLALARLLGEPSGDAAWKLTSWDAPQTIGSEKSWVTTALLRRPEIQSQRWELAALGVETRLARYSVFEGTGVGAKSERDDVWTVGPSITVPVPLFDWGQAKRAKAAALQSEAEHNLTKAQRTVIEEVRSAFAAYAESTAATTLARDRLVPAQERRRKETEEAYTSGQTDVTSLVVADADLLASKIKLIELEEQASGSLVKLERAVGGSGIAAELEHRGSARTGHYPSRPRMDERSTDHEAVAMNKRIDMAIKQSNFSFAAIAVLVGLSILTIFAAPLSVVRGADADQDNTKSTATDAGETTQVTLTPEAIKRYGVAMGQAKKQKLISHIIAPAQVAFNSNAMAVVGCPVQGRVTELKVAVGDAVKKGDELLMVESPELGEAQSDYLQKRTGVVAATAAVDPLKSAYERAKDLYATQGITLTEVQKRQLDYTAAQNSALTAQAAVKAAESRLKLLGMDKDAVARLVEAGDITPQFTVRALLDGTVTERLVTLGELVKPDREKLLVVADMTTLWVIADVPEARIAEVKPGEKVSIAVGDQSFDGVVSRTGISVDPSTRSVPVQIEVKADPALKPGMFAEADIKTTVGSDPVVAVPSSAIQSVDGSTAVFVPVAGQPNTFARRMVSVGDSAGGMVSIIAGLDGGEQIVTSGTFILKAELGKASAKDND